MASGISRRRSNNNSNDRRLPRGDFNFRTKEHSQKLLGNLHSLRCQLKFCDVEISVDHKVFHGHRAILAASSPYFDAMFSSGLAEQGQKSIEIKDITPWTFNLIIGFIYSGNVKITKDNVQDLLAAANMLEMPEIQNACCDFLSKELHSSNCIGIFMFAELHACNNLRLESKRYIERHFKEVIEEDEFYDLPKDTLKMFLRSEGLSIDNEFQLFTATMNWVLHDISQRIEFINEVLETIRLPIISTRQLEAYVDECSNSNIQVVLNEVLSDHKIMMHKNGSGINHHDIRTKPRMCARRCLLVIGGYHRGRNQRWEDSVTLNLVESYDVNRHKWCSLPVINFPRSGHGMAIIDGIVYVVGGESECMILDNGEAYDPVSNKWAFIKPMNQPRCVLGACELNRQLFVFGGWIGVKIGDTIERYDPVTNHWTLEGTMTGPRYAMGVIAHENLIYVIGGLNEHGLELDLVECYNPENKRWKSLAPMHCPRAYPSLAILHGLIYVAGGTNSPQTSLNKVERYSPEDNKWTVLTSMSQCRAGASAAAINDMLYVMGGRSSGHRNMAPMTLTSIEIYNPETNCWVEDRPMPTGRCEATVIVL